MQCVLPARAACRVCVAMGGPVDKQGFGRLVVVKTPRAGGPFEDPGWVLRMEFQRACRLSNVTKRQQGVASHACCMCQPQGCTR